MPTSQKYVTNVLRSQEFFFQTIKFWKYPTSGTKMWRAGVPKLLTSVQTCPWLRWSNAWYPTESPASNESLTSSSHARITSTEPETMAQS